MITNFLIALCLLGCSATVVGGQVKKKVPGKPITTQTATTSDGRTVILKSDGTWSYENSGPSANLVTLTGKCRLQLIGSRFFPCQTKVVFLQKPGYSHLAFVTKDKSSEIIYSLSGQADRQPNLENYYLQIDTLSFDGIGEHSGNFTGMEGECHFRMNKSATMFNFVKCEIYNRSKGTSYNFYLEKITKTHREVIN